MILHHGLAGFFERSDEVAHYSSGAIVRRELDALDAGTIGAAGRQTAQHSAAPIIHVPKASRLPLCLPAKVLAADVNAGFPCQSLWMILHTSMV